MEVRGWGAEEHAKLNAGRPCSGTRAEAGTGQKTEQQRVGHAGVVVGFLPVS